MKDAARSTDRTWRQVLFAVGALSLCMTGGGALWAQSQLSRETPYGRIEITAADPDTAARVLDDILQGKTTIIVWDRASGFASGKPIGHFTWGETAIVNVFGPLAGHHVLEARWYEPDGSLYGRTIEPLQVDNTPGPKNAQTSLRFPHLHESSEFEQPVPEGAWKVDLFLDGTRIAIQEFRFER